MLPVNFVAVLVAALANFVIGFLFHGPLFGKTWMKLAKITPTGNEKFADMIPQMVKNYLANVVCAFVLAGIYHQIVLQNVSSSLSGAVGYDVWGGMITAFWLWLGFIVTGSSMEVIWMKRSTKLWLFEIVSSLVAMLAMGAIIAVW
jgi:hypothetical protein